MKRSATNNDYLKDFLLYMSAERGYSRNTIESYERNIKHLIKFLSKKKIKHIAQVTYDDFIQFLSTLREMGLSASSITKAIESCKLFVRFLRREEILTTRSPILLAPRPKVWQKVPETLTYEEMLKILETPNIYTKRGLRDRAILELLYGSGLRVSELCNLRVRDFDFERGFVKVIGKGNKWRHIPFNQTSAKFLREYWREYFPDIQDEDFAFISKKSRLSRFAVHRLTKKYVKRCGIEKNIHPHSFRHTFACHLLEGGADLRLIQDMMGHADISATGGYLHLDLRDVKDKFHKHHLRDISDLIQSTKSPKSSQKGTDLLISEEVTRIIEQPLPQKIRGYLKMIIKRFP